MSNDIRAEYGEFADEIFRDKVYRELLDKLKLSVKHREDLQARGMADEQIELGLFRTLPRPVDRPKLAKQIQEEVEGNLLSVPGFIVNRRKNLSIAGKDQPLMIPCFNECGLIVSVKLRNDTEEKDNRYVRLSSSANGGHASPNALHFPPGFKLDTEDVRIVEGELKAIIAQQKTGIPTLSVPGVQSWRLAFEAIQTLSNVKRVIIAFDADAKEKKQVGQALYSLASELMEHQIRAQIETWEPEHGNGIDNVLSADHPVILIDDKTEVDDFLASLPTIENKPKIQLEVVDPDEVTSRAISIIETDGVDSMYEDETLFQELACIQDDSPEKIERIRKHVKSQKESVAAFDKKLKLVARSKRKSSGTEYEEKDGCLVAKSVDHNGQEMEFTLSHFTAKIETQVTVDDGENSSVRYLIRGQTSCGRTFPLVDIPAKDFKDLYWIDQLWGADAIIEAGRHIRDHLRCAIQKQSVDSMKRQTRFTHTGWRKINGCMVYLHGGGGAIGSDEDCCVQMPENMRGYVLPSPGQLIQESVDAFMRFLSLTDKYLTLVAIAAIVRSIFGDCDFSLWFHGRTQTFKSEFTALMAQFFGASMTRTNLPCNWSSTANAIESMLFHAKDSILIIDDAVNDPAMSGKQTIQTIARVVRSQGNRAGRARLNAELDQRATKLSRSLLISSAEIAISHHSLQSRTLSIEIHQGQIKSGDLRLRQQDAATGLYAQFTSNMIAWVQPQFESLRKQLIDRASHWRDHFNQDRQDSPARTGDILGHLMAALEVVLLPYLKSTGYFSEEEEQRLTEDALNHFNELFTQQADSVREVHPEMIFLRYLRSAVDSKRAYLSAPNGTQPKDPDRYGYSYEEREVPSRDSAPPEIIKQWRSTGDRIGWITDEGKVYLDPKASVKVATRMAKEAGEHVDFHETRLGRDMKHRGWLFAYDPDRNTYRWRMPKGETTEEGIDRPRVWAINWDEINE